jgi:hypothetical protein
MLCVFVATLSCSCRRQRYLTHRSASRSCIRFSRGLLALVVAAYTTSVALARSAHRYDRRPTLRQRAGTPKSETVIVIVLATRKIFLFFILSCYVILLRFATLRHTSCGG